MNDNWEGKERRTSPNGRRNVDACKMCPAHPFIVEKLTNNKNDIKWIMRTQIVTLLTTVLALAGWVVVKFGN